MLHRFPERQLPRGGFAPINRPVPKFLIPLQYCQMKVLPMVSYLWPWNLRGGGTHDVMDAPPTRRLRSVKGITLRLIERAFGLLAAVLSVAYTIQQLA